MEIESEIRLDWPELELDFGSSDAAARRIFHQPESTLQKKNNSNCLFKVMIISPLKRYHKS
jgi:hypothetical protein